MNPEQIRAFIERNKVTLGAAGAAAVAGLALLRNRSAKADTAATPALPGLGSALSAGGAPTSGSVGSYYPVSYVGASGGYDSTSSDVYNAIQPQLEALGQQNADLKALYEKATSPIPVSVPAGFYGRAGGTGIYQVDDQGNRDNLSMAEYLALGTPAYTKIARDNQFWTQTKVVGGDSGTWD